MSKFTDKKTKMVEKDFDPVKVLQTKRLYTLCSYLLLIMPLAPLVAVAQNNPETRSGQPISSAKNGDAPTHHYSDGELIRQRGTPTIYVIEKGIRHVIPDPKTFNARGYSWGAIKDVSANEMRIIPEGKQIPSTFATTTRHFSDGELIRQSGTPAIYVIERGMRRLIPNLKTFKARGYVWGAIKDISFNEMHLITEGQQIPSVK